MAQSLSSAAEEHSSLVNSAARADLIRSAVRELARMEAEAKAIRAEIAEYKATHIKGDLGFKLADWNAVYRVSQLEIEDRDVLLDTVREGFAVLGIGGIVDWVDAAEGNDDNFGVNDFEPAAPKRGRGRPRKNGAATEADAGA